jgi:hypothetical protein
MRFVQQGPLARSHWLYGKPARTPLANATVAPVNQDSSNPYKALVAKPYNYHLNCWWKALINNHGKCLLCRNTACNTNHKTQNFPILNKIGLKVEKRTDADLQTMPLGLQRLHWTLLPHVHLLLPPWAHFPWIHLAPHLNQTHLRRPQPWTCMTQARSLITMVSGTGHFMFLAVNLTRVTFTWVFLHPFGMHPPDPFLEMGGPVILRIPASHLLPMLFAIHLSIPPHPLRWSSPFIMARSQGNSNHVSPQDCFGLLNYPPVHSISFLSTQKCPCTSLLIADTGATNHMIPDKSAFISFYPLSGCQVCMSNNSFAPILGHGSAIISHNGKMILICHCLHVPDLCNPVYSFQAHQGQHGCGYISMYGMG